MAPETKFCLDIIEGILNTIPSGPGKLLAILPNKLGDVVTNPNNKVQYAHNQNLNRSSPYATRIHSHIVWRWYNPTPSYKAFVMFCQSWVNAATLGPPTFP